MTIKEVEKLKPIPKYIRERIVRLDKKRFPSPYGQLRFYAYLFLWKRKEPIKVTVAVKHYRKKLYMKQVAVHALHGVRCFVKDMEYGNYRAMGYKVGWFDQGITKNEYWYERRGWCWANDKYYDPYATIVNYEVIDRLPQYKYSAFRLYNGCNLFKYLRIYEQYPRAEMLVKLGLGYFATSVQILRKVGKDKQFRRWLYRHREELYRGYYVSTTLLAYKTGKPFDVVQKFEKRKKEFCRDRDYKPIRELFRGKLEQFFSYIDEKNISPRLYLDYLVACNYLNLDMTENKNRIPHNFMRWHDIRIDQYHTAKAMKDAEERKELYAKFALIAEKYLPLQREQKDAFIVVIARSPQDLIREGDILHHCVGRMNYDQKFVREESLIFFVRNAETPDKPFVTVEYSLKAKKVLQCYGDKDTKPTDDVLEFVNKKWLPFANRQLKKIQAAA